MAGGHVCREFNSLAKAKKINTQIYIYVYGSRDPNVYKCLRFHILTLLEHLLLTLLLFTKWVLVATPLFNSFRLNDYELYLKVGQESFCRSIDQMQDLCTGEYYIDFWTECNRYV